MSQGKPTLDQRRARHAWETIEAIRNNPTRADIVRAAKKLPIRIMTAGLGHALAFVKAKGKSKDLLDSVSKWVLKERQGSTPVVPPVPKAEPTGRTTLTASSKAPARIATGEEDDLLQSIVNGSSDDLRRHTAETLAWLGWFNRFAEAEYREDTEKEGDTP